MAGTSCTTWCQETSPTANRLHGVWAASASDVFAVGDGGKILRRVNGTWTQMTSPTTNNLRGVWGLSSSDVWASGVAVNGVGTVLHFNGTAWSLVPGATTDLESVWAASSTDVWFAGSTVVLRWNGSAFSNPGNFAGPLLSVSGTSSNDVWVTGENTNVHHWNGSAWTTFMPPVGTTSFLCVLAVAVNDVWVSDFMPGKETAHWTGGSTTKWATAAASAGGWNGMSALASNDIWGAGGSHAGHWNGSAWSQETPPGTNPILWSVTTRPGNAWVVGDNGLIDHRTF
ncbi:MAG TPA: hypothetical protein VF516_36905 [Kofleriaceae bacterium]